MHALRGSIGRGARFVGLTALAALQNKSHVLQVTGCERRERGTPVDAGEGVHRCVQELRSAPANERNPALTIQFERPNDVFTDRLFLHNLEPLLQLSAELRYLIAASEVRKQKLPAGFQDTRDFTGETVE